MSVWSWRVAHGKCAAMGATHIASESGRYLSLAPRHTFLSHPRALHRVRFAMQSQSSAPWQDGALTRKTMGPTPRPMKVRNEMCLSDFETARWHLPAGGTIRGALNQRPRVHGSGRLSLGPAHQGKVCPLWRLRASALVVGEYPPRPAAFQVARGNHALAKDKYTQACFLALLMSDVPR